MPDTIKIRLSAVEDAEEILNLQKSAFLEQGKLYNNFKLPPLVETIDDMRKDYSVNTIFKAMLNDVIVGSIRAAVKERTCFISRLIVDPDHQNQGIGSILMLHVESVYQNTADRFELFTGQISEKNIYLYSKLGYRIFRTDDTYTVPICYMEKWNKLL